MQIEMECVCGADISISSNIDVEVVRNIILDPWLKMHSNCLQVKHSRCDNKIFPCDCQVKEGIIND